LLLQYRSSVALRSRWLMEALAGLVQDQEGQGLVEGQATEDQPPA
jgi:hypothetical protein